MVSAQLAEELPDVADEQVGGLHGGEVAAAAEFGPVRATVCSSSTVRRIDTSRGNTATPVGTVERSLAPQAPACANP